MKILDEGLVFWVKGMERSLSLLPGLVFLDACSDLALLPRKGLKKQILRNLPIDAESTQGQRFACEWTHYCDHRH